jgi:hypothetical protein
MKVDIYNVVPSKVRKYFRTKVSIFEARTKRVHVRVLYKGYVFYTHYE